MKTFKGMVIISFLKELVLTQATVLHRQNQLGTDEDLFGQTDLRELPAAFKLQVQQESFTPLKTETITSPTQLKH